MRRGFKLTTLAALTAAFMAMPPISAAAFSTDKPLYKDAHEPIPVRVDDLIRRMTLEEKVAQLESRITTTAFGRAKVPDPFRDGQIDPVYAKQYLQNGLGTVAFLNDFLGTAGPAAEGLERRNMLQRWVVENTRLGVPILFHGEGLHGAVTKGATVFPQAIGLGSTWDPGLLKKVYGVVASEARASGNVLILLPLVCHQAVQAHTPVCSYLSELDVALPKASCRSPGSSGGAFRIRSGTWHLKHACSGRLPGRQCPLSRRAT